MRLRSNEFCPIHKSLSCCGRETLPKPRLVRLGVQRVEDPHHPRGYRELRSLAEMRKLLNRKVRQQAGICAICHEEFTDYNDIVPDHKNPKGMCLSSIILSPPNSNVKMSPHERKDIRVESEGTATSERNFQLR